MKTPKPTKENTMTKDQTNDTLAAQGDPAAAMAATAPNVAAVPQGDPAAAGGQGDDTLAGGGAQAGGAEEPVQGIPTTHHHPTLAEMHAAIAMVEGGNNDFGRAALLDEINEQNGCARLSEEVSPELAPGNHYVGYLGIEVASPTSMAEALTVWCQKARRACMSGIYADEPAPVTASEGAAQA